MLATLMLLASASIVSRQDVGPEDVSYAAHAPGGYLAGSHLRGGYLVAKYSPTGSVIWKAVQPVPKNQWESVAGMTSDAEGNSYFASLITDPKSTWTISKWNPAGKQEWTKTFIAEASLLNGCTITTDPQGGFLTAAIGREGKMVQGQLRSVAGILTTRFDGSGNCIWQKFYGNPTSPSYVEQWITVAKDGRIYVATTESGIRARHIVVVCYDSGGTQLWASQQSYKGTDSVSPMVHAVSDGVVVVYQGDNERTEAIAAFKLSSDGKLVWQQAYDDPHLAHLTGFSVDSTGRTAAVGWQIYGASAAFENTLYDRAVVVVFSPSGKLEWFRQSEPNASDSGDPRSVVLGADGSVYMSEGEYGRGNMRVGVRRYSPRGKLMWHHVLQDSDMLGQGAVNRHMALTDSEGDFILFAPILGFGENELSNNGFYRITPAGKVIAHTNVDLRVNAMP